MGDAEIIFPKKEFNLSNEIVTILAEDQDDGLEKEGKYIPIWVVKKFIKEIKKRIKEYSDCKEMTNICCGCMMKELNKKLSKLAGDKLK